MWNPSLDPSEGSARAMLMGLIGGLVQSVARFEARDLMVRATYWSMEESEAKMARTRDVSVEPGIDARRTEDEGSEVAGGPQGGHNVGVDVHEVCQGEGGC